MRVRYVECDTQGHVFNAHYLTWFDDELAIAVAPGAPTTSSLITRFAITRSDDRIAEGFLRHVCVDAETHRKVPWPDELRSALDPYVPG